MQSFILFVINILDIPTSHLLDLLDQVLLHHFKLVSFSDHFLHHLVTSSTPTNLALWLWVVKSLHHVCHHLLLLLACSLLINLGRTASTTTSSA